MKKEKFAKAQKMLEEIAKNELSIVNLERKLRESEDVNIKIDSSMRGYINDIVSSTVDIDFKQQIFDSVVIVIKRKITEITEDIDKIQKKFAKL